MIKGVHITEIKPSKLTEYPNGYEVVSNDGEMKIVLKKMDVFLENLHRSYYSTTYYVKEGTGWVKTTESNNYNSKEEFIDALYNVLEFSEAIDDYKKNNR